jgi:3-dehydroquinate dehydratase/shikimate dehydrogenase
MTTRICVPLSDKTVSELVASISKANSVADLIELRMDAVESFEVSTSFLNSLIHKSTKPVILTFRPSEQGGYQNLSLTERLRFWEAGMKTDAALFDLEIDLVQSLVDLDGDKQPNWSRVICSYHDFSGPSPNIDQIYDELIHTPARIAKLAIKANDITDNLDVFRLIDRSRQDGSDSILIAMDEPGKLSRLLGPARGSYLTYGALAAEVGTAPGQVTEHDLRSIYRIDEINDDTMITGLVGLPVSHSVSPHMHNAAFKSLELNGVYLPLEVKQLDSFIRRMVNPETREIEWNLRGLSVTAPHKVGVMGFLDWIDQRAEKIGAVNTIVVENEKLLGYNTDADGFIEPLLNKVESLLGARVAVIGAGGAAKAAVFALQEKNADVTLHVRDVDKARTFCDQFTISCEPLSTSNFAGKDVVINTTPIGSFGSSMEQSPVSSNQLKGCRVVYDLVYNPVETRLLSEAKEVGCETLGGLEMLVAQARLQFKLWTGGNVSSELMYSAAIAGM